MPYLKPFESTYVSNRPIENPMERSLDQLHLDKTKMKSKFYIEGYLAYYDVVIIGGGAMGCSVAFWLAQRFQKDGMNILVVERDPQVHQNL